MKIRDDCILLAMEESNVFKITRRELEILILITQGLNSKQIASELNISLATVKDHRKSLLMKLSAKNCAELCYKAAKYNLI